MFLEEALLRVGGLPVPSEERFFLRFLFVKNELNSFLALSIECAAEFLITFSRDVYLFSQIDRFEDILYVTKELIFLLFVIVRGLHNRIRLIDYLLPICARVDWI